MIADVLHVAAESSPDRLAVATSHEALSYRDLARRASTLAATLRRSGVGAGDAVAIWLPNGAAWLTAYWGATLNGNVVVPLSTRCRLEEAVALLTRAGAKSLCTVAELPGLDVGEALPRIFSAARECLELVIVRGAGSDPLPDRTLAWESLPWEEESCARVWETAKARAREDSVHLIQLTSGSSGEPKGAMLTGEGLLVAARHHCASWQLSPGDAVFVPNPFSHILGFMYGVLTPCLARATVVTQPVFDVAEAADLVERYEVVAMTGAPTHLQMLAEGVPDASQRFRRLRLAFTGGAAIAPEWVERIREVLGLKALINGYGMSEVGSIAQTLPDDPPELIASSVGFPMPGLEVRIVDPESGGDLDAGRVGELWIRGASVMRGYLSDESATAMSLTEDHWLRTGDLLRRGADGRLSFSGRLSDMFTVGGFNVYPRAVERVLEGHPDVAQAQVVGVPDDRLGSVPVAFVRRHRNEVDRETLFEMCKGALRNYMVPRIVQFVDSLPLTASGKIDRKLLEARAAAMDRDSGSQ